LLKSNLPHTLELPGTYMLKTIAKNTFAQGVGKIITILLSVVSTAFLSRYLQPAGYGDYTFIMSFVLLFGNISDWGTNIIAVREASHDSKKHPVVFGSIAIFRILLAIFSILLLNIAVRVNSNWESLVFPTTIASFVLFGLSLKTSASIVFQTLLKLENGMIVEILSSVVFLIGILFLAFTNKGGINEAMVIWVGSTFIAAGVGMFLAMRLSPVDLKINWNIVKNVIWEALPTGAFLIVFTIYNRIDTIILQNYQGSTAVGIYGLSYKIHDNLVLGAVFLMNSLFPLYSKKFSLDSKKEISNYYQKTFDVLLPTAIFVFVITYLFAPVMVNVLGGPQYFQSTEVLRILVFATFIAYFNHLTGFSLIAFRKQKTLLVVGLTALIFNVLANLLFVPKYSYNASAIITIATEGLVLLLSSIAIWKTIGIVPTPFSFLRTASGFLKEKFNAPNPS